MGDHGDDGQMYWFTDSANCYILEHYPKTRSHGGLVQIDFLGFMLIFTGATSTNI